MKLKRKISQLSYDYCELFNVAWCLRDFIDDSTTLLVVDVESLTLFPVFSILHHIPQNMKANFFSQMDHFRLFLPDICQLRSRHIGKYVEMKLYLFCCRMRLQ